MTANAIAVISNGGAMLISTGLVNRELRLRKSGSLAAMRKALAIMTYSEIMEEYRAADAVMQEIRRARENYLAGEVHERAHITIAGR
jgi:hypothetical protein